MNKFLIPLTLTLLFLSSCLREELFTADHLPDGVLAVRSYPSGMSQVESRTSKDEFEMKISNKYMFIFDADGQLVKKDYKSGDATFLIDRKDDPAFTGHPDPNKLKACDIYIVANLGEGAFADAVTKTEFLQHRVFATTLHPDQLADFPGMPMIGVQSGINLDPNEAPPVIDPIALGALYAKIIVNFQVKPTQVVPGKISSFHLKQWRVYNAPAYATLGMPGAKEETAFVQEQNPQKQFVYHAGEAEVTGPNPISGSDVFTFQFYMLEHKVNPQNLDAEGNYPGYPPTVAANPSLKQRYKPVLCTQHQTPVYILIEGQYTDHQEFVHDITYRLYLGENNSDNFYINRNTRLVNNVTIRGISNNDSSVGDGGEATVSIDHRVHVAPRDVDIIVERESLLDSHIEIRPVDIVIKDPGKGTHVDIALVDPSTKKDIKANQSTWVRFEQKKSAPQGDKNFCTNGMRRYFTTKLVTTTLKKNISTTISSNDDNRIWIYFDENLAVSETGMRTAMLRFSFYQNNRLVRTEYCTFRQHDLYPIQVNGKVKYCIEYYEEYLYNFDKNEHEDKTTDGMAWGQKDVLYSEGQPAIEGSNFIDEWFLSAVIDAGGKYDYKDNYKGKEYTQKLVKKGDGTTDYFKLTLDSQPRSAAEYCYNKNKRDENGNVPANQNNWYLPAIGEIQEITSGAYAKFTVFQDKYYWSSQTSYNNGTWEYKGFLGIIGNNRGTYYIENEQYARATKTVKLSNGSYSYVPSETRGVVQDIYAKWTDNKAKVTNHPEVVPDMDPGNQPRDAILRVRAVRLPPAKR